MDPATTEIYTLSLHDALPIYLLLVREGSYSGARWRFVAGLGLVIGRYRLTLAENPGVAGVGASYRMGVRSEEHTSELQSHSDLVCRLLLEKKKKNIASTSLSS